VESLAPELLLEALAGRDVAVVDDDAVDGRVIEQVLQNCFDRPPRSVGVPSAEFARHLGARRPHDVGEETFAEVAIVGMDDLEGGLAQALIDLDSEDALSRRAFVGDRAVGAHDHVDIDRILHE